MNKMPATLEALNRTLLGKPPKESWLSLSQTARDMGHPLIGLKILFPAIYPESGTSHASDAEKIEYAANLYCLGAFEEANRLLEPISAEKNPEKLYAQGLGFTESYNFRSAIAPLTQYVRNAKLDERQRQQGRLLLGTALLHIRQFTEAAQCLPDPGQHQLTLELWTELEISRGHFEDAKKHLNKLEGFSKQLWQNLLDFCQSKGSADSQVALRELRKEAFLKKHWDALRLCDQYEALVLKDEKLLTHIVYGSPFAGFRSFVESHLGRALHLPTDYFWQPRGAKGVGVTFDLARGALDNGKASLKVGQSLHRLLVCLCSDFYRPIKMATLHAEVFPKSHFDPNTSPTRVHQVVKRLRQWIESSGVPLLLESEVGIYQLVGTGPCRIRITAAQSSKDPDQLVYQKLLECFSENAFSSQQVAQEFKLSTRSARRVLSRLVDRGLLETFGSGTKTRYCKPKLKAAA